MLLLAGHQNFMAGQKLLSENACTTNLELLELEAEP